MRVYTHVKLATRARQSTAHTFRAHAVRPTDRSINRSIDRLIMSWPAACAHATALVGGSHLAVLRWPSGESLLLNYTSGGASHLKTPDGGSVAGFVLVPHELRAFRDRFAVRQVLRKGAVPPTYDPVGHPESFTFDPATGTVWVRCVGDASARAFQISLSGPMEQHLAAMTHSEPDIMDDL